MREGGRGRDILCQMDIFDSVFGSGCDSVFDMECLNEQ